MRLLMLCLLAACAGSSTPSSQPATARYAPVETVTVRGSPGEATRRLVGVYTADGITIASNTGGTVTTAPVFSQALSAGSGATGATGTVDYFYRATVTGDSISTVTLSLWGRLITRSGSDPESPARETPIAASCASDARCAPFLTRMRQHAAKLR